MTAQVQAQPKSARVARSGTAATVESMPLAVSDSAVEVTRYPTHRVGQIHATWHTFSMLVPPGWPIGSPQVMA